MSTNFRIIRVKNKTPLPLRQEGNCRDIRGWQNQGSATSVFISNRIDRMNKNHINPVIPSGKEPDSMTTG